MEKEKLLSKLNIKDYNNQLEKILTKKAFSGDTKNLLLSMLYKVESAYEDYKTVNVETKTKKEILEEILDIIENDCEMIEIVKTQDSKTLPEEKKIITYLNARKMLYEIYQLKQKKFEIQNKYEIIKPALETTLNQGYSISSNEIIRDFDGWSWNIDIDEIENITANVIYQTIKILIGYNFLDSWQVSKNEDYVLKLKEILENKYKTELGENIFKVICQISILNIVNNSANEKNRLIEIQRELQSEFDKFDDKKEYITELGKKKRQLVADIKKIDDIISNDRKLKNEFITRNELLDMNHRIFSLSDFVEVLETEREEMIKKLDIYNKKMEPINFVRTKTEIENKLMLLKEINLKKSNDEVYNEKIKELLDLVYHAIKIQIESAEEKENIVNLIYKIRYYSMMYVDKFKQVKDIIDVNVVQKMIITKACKQKIITIFSKNIKENYEIIRNILKTDIIELEHIYFKFIQNQDKITLEIYDEENICKVTEFCKTDALNVKMNKKIKVFI